MRCLFLILALCFVGCSNTGRINEGAQVPLVFHNTDGMRLAAQQAGMKGHYVGLFHPVQGIRLNTYGLNKAALAQVIATDWHELGHYADYYYGPVFGAQLRSMMQHFEGGDFQLHFDQHAEWHTKEQP